MPENTRKKSAQPVDALSVAVADEVGDISLVADEKRKSAGEKSTATVQLDASAVKSLFEWCDKTDRGKGWVINRLAQWFMANPVGFRQFLLGDTEAEFAEAYARIFERMAAEARAMAILTPDEQRLANVGVIERDSAKPQIPPSESDAPGAATEPQTGRATGRGRKASR